MKILLISNYEFCYNPRLLKAALFFENKGADISILSPNRGMIENDQVYQHFKTTKSWEIIENNISKDTFSSKLKWICTGLVNKLYLALWKRNVSIGFTKVFNKGLIGISHKLKTYDIIIINLIDNLPFAVELAKKNNSKIIYDSQEFFIGQYQHDQPHIKNWVNKAEKNNISKVRVVITTTNVMKEKLLSLYSLKNDNIVRVRNAPYNFLPINNTPYNSKDCIKLIWHGFSIFYLTRGINVIIDAISKCNSNITLSLQGNINSEQKEIVTKKLIELKIADKVILLPPSHPDKIVESLYGYDIGIIGELPIEENQQLTSSNKLFDYIHAGLAVVSSDMLGLIETVKEYNVGLIYKAGNADELAYSIDTLVNDFNLLNSYKKNSIKAAKDITWENDYQIVWEKITK